MSKTKTEARKVVKDFQVGDFIRITKIFDDWDKLKWPFGISLDTWKELMQATHIIHELCTHNNPPTIRIDHQGGYWIPIECCRRYRKTKKGIDNES